MYHPTLLKALSDSYASSPRLQFGASPYKLSHAQSSDSYAAALAPSAAFPFPFAAFAALAPAANPATSSPTMAPAVVPFPPSLAATALTW